MSKTRFHISKKVLLGCLASFNALAVAASSLAWFIAKNKPNISGEGSINKNYFEGGDGSSSNPFLIKYPLQFYYFSWLQDMGYFNHEDESNPGYYKQYHFELIDDIDMSSYILPPAGSQKYPFIGSFNGANYSISNINITNSSSTYTDEPENPNNDERNYQIMGVFGVVGSYGNMPYTFNSSINTIKDLHLSNVTINSVSPRNNQTLMGIAAGYVNDNTSDSTKTLDNILVSGNSSLNSSATSPLSLTSHLSDYSLVGFTNNTKSIYVQETSMKAPALNASDGGEGSAIIDDEDGSGGQLLINPNLAGNQFTALSQGQYRAVPGSATDTSFFVGALQRGTTSGGFQSKKVYNNTISEAINSDVSVTVTTSNSTNFNSENTAGTDLMEIGNLGNPLYILPSGAPSFTNNFTTVTFSDNTTLALPQKGIWFKPLNSGDCMIALTKTNNKSDESLCMYSYLRDKTTKQIITNSVRKTEITVQKSLGNKCLIGAKIHISEQSITDEREYLIAAVGSSTAGFAYLVIAGADSQGGTGIPESVEDSKYAVYEQLNVDLSTQSSLDGINFLGDTSAVYQLNAINRNYTFSSQENSATTYTSSGSPSDVTKPNLNPYGQTTNIQTIYSFDENNDINLIMRKTTIGTTNTYEYKHSFESDFEESTASAMSRYFGENAIFSNTELLTYHHVIANASSTILPAVVPVITNVGGVYSLNNYVISTDINKDDVSIDYVDTASVHPFVFNATGGQIYPNT